MRLLNIDSLEVEEFVGSIVPPYTILSHTWNSEEVTLQHLRNGSYTALVGFRKLQYVYEQTRRDGLHFTWVDTFCIDRSSTTELAEAVNSMYRWYSNAAKCYVYLSDVRYTEGEDIDPTSAFCHSRWFTRSWTLQELIAPNSVIFYDTNWRYIGTKESLLDIVSVVTGIPQPCLTGEKTPADFSVATRFSWASKRTCMRIEDIAYSLMGLFDVHMPLLYGEGEKAFFRLQETIFKSIDDQSIFSWCVSRKDSRYAKPSSIFARSPADFAEAADIHTTAQMKTSSSFTNRGLTISLPLGEPSESQISSLPEDDGRDASSIIKVASLNCGPDSQQVVQIFLLSSLSSPTTFCRLAATLVIVKRPRKLEYRNIHIKTGLENLLQSIYTVPRYDMTEPAPPKLISDLANELALEAPLLRTVVDILTGKMVYNIAGRLFLPEGTLNKVLDDDLMLRLLRELPHPPGHTTEEREYIYHRYRKTFATLALSGLLRFFQIMVDELGISDECLPMPDPKFLSSSTLPIGAGRAEHLEKWKSVILVFENKASTQKFFEQQWCVLAPVFRSSDHVQHYSISQHHILPFVRNMPGSSGRRNFLKSGSSGDIQKVYIHPDHYDFETGFGARFSKDDSIHEPHNFFAVKTLRETDRKVFEMEKSTLERFRKLGSLTILQLLASYEIRASDLDPTPITYHMLFPWADGNLWEFWESNGYSHNESIVPWIAEQCRKLADALRIIHTGYLQYAPGRDKPEHFYGIHGDIKPANILRFPVSSAAHLESLGRLVVGDFGLSNFHRENTPSIVNPSNAGYSITYSAPEYMLGGEISCKVDIWALGCTFLEFIIWFLMGSDAVICEFPDLRVDTDTTSPISSDTFFELIPYDGSRTSSARLKPVVLEWINMLYSNDGCSEYLKDFLHIIHHRMLVAEPDERIQADELSRNLEEMYLRCLIDPHYYHVDRSPRNSPARDDVSFTKSKELLEGRETKPRKGMKRKFFFSLMHWLCFRCFRNPSQSVPKT